MKKQGHNDPKQESKVTKRNKRSLILIGIFREIQEVNILIKQEKSVHEMQQSRNKKEFLENKSKNYFQNEIT